MLDWQQKKSKRQFIMARLAWSPVVDQSHVRSKAGIDRGGFTPKKERAGYKTPYPA